MRISDWSSDVCSSDLAARHPPAGLLAGVPHPSRSGARYRTGEYVRRGRQRLAPPPCRVARGASPAVLPPISAPWRGCRDAAASAATRRVRRRRRGGSGARAHGEPAVERKSTRLNSSEEHTSELQSL